jgi:hypothetical protein
MGDGSFLVEDFIHAITSQLDRVQDALRLKAVNRPLTYALKDMSLELKVFVEMDNEGNVRFRSSGPNETGSSVVSLGFTTITKPMIEENTISMAATRSPALSDLGLSREEQQRLERMGVRNAAQLNSLRQSAGIQTVARLGDLPVDRLRAVLGLARPSVGGVTPQPARPPVAPPPPIKTAPAPPPSRGTLGPIKTVPVTRPPVATPVRNILVPSNTRLLGIEGSNLLALGAEPEVRWQGRPLAVRELDDDRLVVENETGFESGALEVILPGGESVTYEVQVADPEVNTDELGLDEYDPRHNGRTQD